MRSKDGWIPVWSCKPGYEQTVLVATEKGDVHVVTEYYPYPENRTNLFYAGSPVTHWMPLPNAPDAKPYSMRIRDLEKHTTELDERISCMEMSSPAKSLRDDEIRREVAREIKDHLWSECLASHDPLMVAARWVEREYLGDE